MSAAIVVVMYTDGACRGNPGKGGYGIILMAGQYQKEFSAGYRLTTNNRMELLAVIVGLEQLRKLGMRVLVYSDSKYVVDSVEKGWLHNWIRTEFKGGKKNKDLWLRYCKLSKQHQVQFQWVKGHANNPYNNRCDVLATTAADGGSLAIDHAFEQNQA